MLREQGITPDPIGPLLKSVIQLITLSGSTQHFEMREKRGNSAAASHQTVVRRPQLQLKTAPRQRDTDQAAETGFVMQPANHRAGLPRVVNHNLVTARLTRRSYEREWSGFHVSEIRDRDLDVAAGHEWR